MNIVDKIASLGDSPKEANTLKIVETPETTSDNVLIVVGENPNPVVQNQTTTTEIEVSSKKDLVQHKLVDLEEKLEKDFEKSRNVLNDLLDMGMRSFKDLSTLANDSETPRAYEILATLMNGIADTSEKLLNTHSKKAQIEFLKSQGVVGKNTSVTEIGNVENAVFVGTSNELLKVLTGMKHDPNIIDPNNETSKVILDPKPERRSGDEEDNYEYNNIIDAEFTEDTSGEEAFDDLDSEETSEIVKRTLENERKEKV